MTKSIVNQSKIANLEERLAAMRVKPQDYKEVFTTGGGKGGQKVNKTSSRVQLTYLPTGKVFYCQKDRNLTVNRFLAKRMMCEYLEKELLNQKSKSEIKNLKLKKQKKKKKTTIKIYVG